MSVTCETCGNGFVSKYVLKKHQRTARYCMAISTFTCPYCPYKTKLEDQFIEHTEECEYLKYSKDLEEENAKLTEEIAELSRMVTERDVLATNKEKVNLKLRKDLQQAKARIAALQKEIMDLKLKNANSEGKITVYKERPGTVNNNQYVNKLLQVKCDTIRPFTIETVRDDVKEGKYTFERYIQAEKGLIDFISDIIAQDEQRSYVCTDSSRQRFHRLLESREWRDDNGATFLNKVLDELREPATTYYGKVTDMMVEGDRELADVLMDKTRTMALGIINPKSKDRELTFTKIRNEVKKLSSI